MECEELFGNLFQNMILNQHEILRCNTILILEGLGRWREEKDN